MLISVIIPFCNEIELIEDTVSSVFEQNTTQDGFSIEVCIGNDGPYSTGEILDRISVKYRKAVNIVSNCGVKGPGGTRNTAINIAKGDIIAFLDADDCWLPTKLSLQLPLFDMGVNFSATGYQFDTGVTLIEPPLHIGKPLDIFSKLGIGTSTVMMRRDLLGETRFRNLRFSQDIDFWYRVAAHPKFSYSPIMRPLTLYRTNGSTRNKLDQAKSFWHVLKINDISLVQRLLVMRQYAVRGIYNHYINRWSQRNG